MIKIILIYLAAVNLAAFIVYGWDKRLAVRERYRISEKTLILLALFGGSIGSLAAMHLFHHKTRKKKFGVGSAGNTGAAGGAVHLPDNTRVWRLSC